MRLKPFIQVTNNKDDEVIAFGAQIVIAKGWKVVSGFFLWFDFTIGFREREE